MIGRYLVSLLPARIGRNGAYCLFKGHIIAIGYVGIGVVTGFERRGRGKGAIYGDLRH